MIVSPQAIHDNYGKLRTWFTKTDHDPIPLSHRQISAIQILGRFMHHAPPNHSDDSRRAHYSWKRAIEIEKLADDSAIEVLIGKTVIAIFRSGGKTYALDGMCSHQGGPIAEGTVQHGCVTCPWHGWQYELHTGIQTINRQPLQECFDTRQADGWIEVFVGE